MIVSACACSDDAPQLLLQAVEFIEENAHGDIALVDVARAVYVTPRALQYMFRKHCDCSPMTYVRRVRLHRAHLELVAGTRRTTTVADTALRWKFAHAGRFADYYRQSYGCSPHVTLRERQTR